MIMHRSIATAALLLWTSLGLAADEAGDSAALFRRECAAKAESATGMNITGLDGWRFFKGELRHVGVGEFWGPAAQKSAVAATPENKDPLPAILNYKEELETLGIELLIVPVPPKCAVYPDKLNEKFKAPEAQSAARLDACHQEFYRQLTTQGVKVLDLVPVFAAARSETPTAPLYCLTDTHWSGAACVSVAQAIAREIQSRDWLKPLSKKQFETQEKTVTIRGDLVEPTGGSEAGEKVALRFVGTKSDAGLTPVNLDPDSPVVLMSDSHGLVFHVGEDLFARGAGLPDQLAYELGMPIDMIASRGDGATKVRMDLYRRAKADAKWLAGKKIVIWCFSAREFTECANGWRKLPVKK